MATETKVIEYDKENSQLRQELEDFISSRGVMQKHISKVINLSTCSISLFLSNRRMLVPEKLELIRAYILKFK